MERSLSRTSSTRTSNWSAKADHSTRMDIGHANEKHFVSVLRQTTFQNVVDHPSAYSVSTLELSRLDYYAVSIDTA